MTDESAFADCDDRDPLPCWFIVGDDGVPIINGQLLRYDLATRQSFAWQDTDPDVLMAYLDKLHRWILDGRFSDAPPAARKFSAVKGGKD